MKKPESAPALTTVALDESTLKRLAEILQSAQPKIDVDDIVANVRGQLEAQLASKIESAVMPKVERKLLTVLVQCGLVPHAVLDDYEMKHAPKNEQPDIGDRVLGGLMS